MFALGLVSWMYGRPTDVTLNWLRREVRRQGAADHDANVAAFKAGYNFGETTELFATSYEVKPAPAEPGIYRNVSGAQALAWGLVAAAERSGLQLFYASYPITPASELLHELSRPQELQRDDPAGRGRDRRRQRRRSAPRSPATSA